MTKMIRKVKKKTMIELGLTNRRCKRRRRVDDTDGGREKVEGEMEMRVKNWN